MTLPDQSIYSLQATRQFLRDLLNPKATPKVPRAVRGRASLCLKHFIWECDEGIVLTALEQKHGPSWPSHRDTSTIVLEKTTQDTTNLVLGKSNKKDTP